MKRLPDQRRIRVLLLTALSLSFMSACGDSPAEPAGRVVEGVDLDALFAPPGSADITAVLDDWAGRDVSAQSVQMVSSSTVSMGAMQATLRIVSHEVGGVRHFGAILVPAGAMPGNLPVLIYSHGGEDGVNVDQLLPLIPLLLASLQDDFVYVIPSFRSEPLIAGGTEYLSGGEPSPWDRDVDDALALLNVALGSTPEVDPGRIGVLGFSRGACVAMLMAARDSRIDLVIEFFGPTDFFGPFVQEVVEEALRGSLRDLPGLDHLNSQFIQPLKNGELGIDDVRDEILRRSPVYFGERLPALQVHHGTEDGTVPVGQAERLIVVMQGLGRTEPLFESYIYVGGTHNPLTLTGSLERTRAYLTALIPMALVAQQEGRPRSPGAALEPLGETSVIETPGASPPVRSSS